MNDRQYPVMQCAYSRCTMALRQHCVRATETVALTDKHDALLRLESAFNTMLQLRKNVGQGNG